MNNNNIQKRTDIEYNLFPMLKMLWSKLWLILLAGLIAGGVAFVAGKLLIKPTYRCGFSAYVNNQHSNADKDTALSYSDLNAAKQLTQTYAHMLRSNSVLTAAADSIGCNLSYEVLKNKTSTEIQNETEIINVYVMDYDYNFAYEFATAISKTAPGFMSEFVEGSSMKVIDYPVLSTKRFGPNYFKFGLFGFLAGILLTMVVLIIRFFKDDTIKDEEEIEPQFGMPILGIVPDSASSTRDDDYYYYGKDDDSEQKRGKTKHEK